MELDFTNIRTWNIPHNRQTRDVLKVVDSSHNITLWKKWYVVSYDANNADLQYWTIKFNSNGGVNYMADMHVKKRQSTTLPACTFARTGYSLKAEQYNTSPYGTGTSYAAGGSITPASDVTLYAQWQPNQHTVSFNANGGSGSMEAITNVSYNSTVQLDACRFSKEGSVFDYWSCIIGDEYFYFSDQDTFDMPDQDITLTAQWETEDYEYDWVVVDEGNGHSSPTAAGLSPIAYTFYGAKNSLGIPKDEAWHSDDNVNQLKHKYYPGLLTDQCNCYNLQSTYECYYWVKLAHFNILCSAKAQHKKLE